MLMKMKMKKMRKRRSRRNRAGSYGCDTLATTSRTGGRSDFRIGPG
jgi:hypothetical protein